MSALTDQLRQREFWTDSDGLTQRVEDMEAGHRANLLRWLQRNATELARTRAREVYPRTSALAGLDAALLEITPEVAERWLAHQPLVRRLVELRRADMTRTRAHVHSPAWPEEDRQAAVAAEERASGGLRLTGSSADDFARWAVHGFPWDPKPVDELGHAQREIADLRRRLETVTAQRDGILRDIKAVRQSVKDVRKELSEERQRGLALQLRLDRVQAQRSGTYHVHVLFPGEAAAPGGSAGQGFYFQVGESFSWEDPRTRLRVSGSPSAKAAFDQAARHMVRRPTATDELDAILFPRR